MFEILSATRIQNAFYITGAYEEKKKITFYEFLMVNGKIVKLLFPKVKEIEKCIIETIEKERLNILYHKYPEIDPLFLIAVIKLLEENEK